MKKKVKYTIWGEGYATKKEIQDKFRSTLNKYATHRPDKNGDIEWTDDDDMGFFIDMIVKYHPDQDGKLTPYPIGVFQRKKDQRRDVQFEMFLRREKGEKIVGMGRLWKSFGKTPEEGKLIKTKDRFSNACRFAILPDVLQFKAEEFSDNPCPVYDGMVMKDDENVEVDHFGDHEFRDILQKFKNELDKDGGSWENCEIVDVETAYRRAFGECKFVDPDISERFRTLHNKLAKLQLLPMKVHRHKPVK